MKPLTLRASAAAFAFAAAAFAAPAAAIPVNTELQLLVDVSGSVDATEFALQRDGYVAAFQNAAVQAELIANGGTAVRMIYWSSATEQQIVGTGSGWFHINSIAAANSFASLVAGFARPFAGLTAIGSAINYAMASANTSFANNGFEGTRLVIDVSGDGATNDGADTIAARNAATTAGVTINGLVILGETDLTAFYQNNVVSSGGFLRTASNFNTFAAAIQDKIITEVSVRPVPEPGTYALLALGLGMFVIVARRRKVTA